MRHVTFVATVAFVLFFSACKKEILVNKQNQHSAQRDDPGGTPQQVLPTNPFCDQTPLHWLNLKNDFGAVGDGVTDDTEAFLLASQYINSNWSLATKLVLYIPKGTYMVGWQLQPFQSIVVGSQTYDNPGGLTRLGIDLLDLRCCQNVAILGDPVSPPTIRYFDNLYYGGFDYALNPVNHAVNGPNPEWAATTGACISLADCSCISVENLVMDGNNRHYILGGTYNGGYQLGSDGLFVRSSSNVFISRGASMRFGRDGMLLMRNNSPFCLPQPVPQNIRVDGFKFDYNSRQGFSWVAGENVEMNKCTFNFTGRVFPSDPSAGVDIEPDDLVNDWCRRGRFNDCRFEDNVFAGFISDDHFPAVDDIYFERCQFWGTTSWSVWPTRMQNTTFHNCTIMGAMAHVAGTSANDLIVFEGCHIGDLPYPVTGAQTFLGGGIRLMDFGAGFPSNIFYMFTACRFEMHRSQFTYMDPIPAWQYTGFDRFYVSNRFQFHTNDMAANGVPLLYNGKFFNATLNNNVFQDMTPAAALPGWWQRYWFGAPIFPFVSCGGTNLSNGANTMTPTAGPFSRVAHNPDICGGNGSNYATF